MRIRRISSTWRSTTRSPTANEIRPSSDAFALVTST